MYLMNNLIRCIIHLTLKINPSIKEYYLSYEQYFSLPSKKRYKIRTNHPNRLRLIPQHLWTIKCGRKTLYKTPEEKRIAHNLVVKKYERKNYVYKRPKKILLTDKDIILKQIPFTVNEKKVEYKTQSCDENIKNTTNTDTHYFFLCGVIIPNEIIVLIFSFILNPVDLCELSYVCKVFYSNFMSNIIWEKIFYKTFNFKIEIKEKETYLCYYKLYLLIYKLKLNLDISKKIKLFELTFTLASSFHWEASQLASIANFYVNFKDKKILVNKNQQNEKDFNAILCKLIYNFECICPYCEGENIGQLYRNVVRKTTNPNIGRYYYRCTICSYFEFEDGQPSLKSYTPFYNFNCTSSDEEYYIQNEYDNNNDNSSNDFNLPI
jgi:hypothetical protein